MQNSTSDAVIIIIISNLIVAFGAWITARITATSEKPTDVFIKSLSESRALIAEKEKTILLLSQELVEAERTNHLLSNERDAYIEYAGKLRRIARRYAPSDVILPEVENGDTPPRIPSVKK